MNAATREPFSKTLWTRFVVMVAIKGTNHSKYGSWKKELCVHWAENRDTYPTNFLDYKKQLVTRDWDPKEEKQNIIRLKRELLW